MASFGLIADYTYYNFSVGPFNGATGLNGYVDYSSYPLESTSAFTSSDATRNLYLTLFQTNLLAGYVDNTAYPTESTSAFDTTTNTWIQPTPTLLYYDQSGYSASNAQAESNWQLNANIYSCFYYANTSDYSSSILQYTDWTYQVGQFPTDPWNPSGGGTIVDVTVPVYIDVTQPVYVDVTVPVDIGFVQYKPMGVDQSNNLALNKTCRAINYYYNGSQGDTQQAVDGNIGTWWSSGQAGPCQQYVDLGAVYSIYAAILYISMPFGQPYYGGTAAFDYQSSFSIQYCSDGSSQIDQYDQTDSTVHWDETYILGGINLRYFKIANLVCPNQWESWCNIYEVQLYPGYNIYYTGGCFPIINGRHVVSVTSIR